MIDFSEVLKALLKTRGLFERWQTVVADKEMRSPEELEWSGTELKNALRSIEWDLEDLDDTVQIVEKNPAKFRMDPAELAVRKNFIAQTRDEVRQMKAITSRHNKTGNSENEVKIKKTIISGFEQCTDADFRETWSL